MKSSQLVIVLFLISMVTFAQQVKTKSPQCDLGVVINQEYSKSRVLDSIMDTYTSELPGVSLAVYSEKEGWWAGTGGYANLEKKLPMENCHLQYIQSVSKSYLGVAILQLWEQNKIDLEAPVTRYLPEKYSRHIRSGDKMTIRMLLSHTSGVPEYNQDPAFISDVMLHPLKNFSLEDCIRAISGKEPQFTPGSRYLYTNTNYMLLSLVADAITGDHAAFIRKHIFERLGLKNSYYSNDQKYLSGLYLPESYWDILNIGMPVKVTPFQQMAVVCSKGDDGIVCTTTDAVSFMKGLVEGKLLGEAAMKEMFDFVKDENGRKRYSRGLICFEIDGREAYGHGGGGIGAGCALLYLPDQKLYLFLATNTGCFIDSRLSARAGEFQQAVIGELLK